MVKRQLPNPSEIFELLHFKTPELNPRRRRLDAALTTWDLRKIAKRRTPAAAFDYTDGAAEGEVSLRRARQAFRDIEFHPDILRPARTWGYTLLQAEVMAFERDKRRVQTSMGWLDYDYLILAGGIRDAFDVWFGNDQRTIDYTRMHYSSAYLPNREMMSLKQRVHAFKGGTLVMTMPPMRMLDSLSTKRAEYHTQPAKMMKKASCPIQSVLSGLKPSATVVSRPPTKI